MARVVAILFTVSGTVLADPGSVCLDGSCDDEPAAVRKGSAMLQTRSLTAMNETSEETQRYPPLTKMGQVCYNGYNFKNGCEVKHVSPFTDKSKLGPGNAGASWFYNYQPSVPEDFKTWMNENNVEFVPMVGWRHVWLNPPDAPHDSRCKTRLKECRCYFTNPDLAPPKAPGRNGPTCTQSDLINTLERTFDGLATRPKYLMGYNEPEDTHFKHKNISPEEAVDYWRRFIQPAAEHFGLKLVTPTVNDGFCKEHSYGCQYQATYLSKFYKACYDHRSSSPPCKLELIEAVSVHLYMCMAEEWHSRFDPKTGRFFADLKTQMGDYGGGSFDWAAYIDSRKIWVTELNCNNDNYGSNTAPGRMDLPSMGEICERITGQAQNAKRWKKRWAWEEGPIHAMESLDSITRWSWWNTWNNGASTVDEARVLNARLVNDDGEAYPQGLAILSGAGKDTDCTQGAAPPTSKLCVETCATDPAAWEEKCHRTECSKCRLCLH